MNVVVEAFLPTEICKTVGPRHAVTAALNVRTITDNESFFGERAAMASFLEENSLGSVVGTFN